MISVVSLLWLFALSLTFAVSANKNAANNVLESADFSSCRIIKETPSCSGDYADVCTLPYGESRCTDYFDSNFPQNDYTLVNVRQFSNNCMYQCSAAASMKKEVADVAEQEANEDRKDLEALYASCQTIQEGPSCNGDYADVCTLPYGESRCTDYFDANFPKTAYTLVNLRQFSKNCMYQCSANSERVVESGQDVQALYASCKTIQESPSCHSGYADVCTLPYGEGPCTNYFDAYFPKSAYSLVNVRQFSNNCMYQCSASAKKNELVETGRDVQALYASCKTIQESPSCNGDYADVCTLPYGENRCTDYFDANFPQSAYTLVNLRQFSKNCMYQCSSNANAIMFNADSFMNPANGEQSSVVYGLMWMFVGALVAYFGLKLIGHCRSASSTKAEYAHLTNDNYQSV